MKMPILFNHLIIVLTLVLVNSNSAQSNVVASYQDWDVKCTSDTDCQIYQLLRTSDGNPIAEISGFPVEDDKISAGFTILLPLETFLETGISISIDGNNKIKYPFVFCSEVGCIVRFGISEETLKKYQLGSNADFFITPASQQDRKIAVSISLSGFTAAYADIYERLGFKRRAEIRRLAQQEVQENRRPTTKEVLTRFWQFYVESAEAGGQIVGTYTCSFNCDKSGTDFKGSHTMSNVSSVQAYDFIFINGNRLCSNAFGPGTLLPAFFPGIDCSLN
jgi:invasion protein IalB